MSRDVYISKNTYAQKGRCFEELSKRVWKFGLHKNDCDGNVVMKYS